MFQLRIHSHDVDLNRMMTVSYIIAIIFIFSVTLHPMRTFRNQIPKFGIRVLASASCGKLRNAEKILLHYDLRVNLIHILS